MSALAKIYDKARGSAAAATVAVGVTAAAFTGASAQENNVTQIAQPVDEISSYEQTSMASHSYASSCFAQEEKCVGIVLHMGQDLLQIRDQAFLQVLSQIAEQQGVDPATINIAELPDATTQEIQRIAQKYVVDVQRDDFAERFSEHNIEIEMFPRDNPDTEISGVTFHTGEIAYETAQGSDAIPLGLAELEVGNVARSIEFLLDRRYSELSENLTIEVDQTRDLN